MRDSPLTSLFHALLVRHDATLSALGGELSRFTGAAQNARLAICLKGYLDRSAQERRESAKLLTERRLKSQPTPNKVLTTLFDGTASMLEMGVPPEAHDVLLARSFLWIQYCQIASLGVLQTILEHLEEDEVLAFVRKALGGQIDAAETLSALLENELAV